MAVVAGIDGCPAGWLCLTKHLSTGAVQARILTSIGEVLDLHPRPQVVMVDMPIGLTARGQSPSRAFGHSKSCAFHGSCTPGTSSMRCSRLCGHSLLAGRGESPLAPSRDSCPPRAGQPTGPSPGKTRKTRSEGEDPAGTADGYTRSPDRMRKGPGGVQPDRVAGCPTGRPGKKTCVWRVSEWLAATLEMWCSERSCGFESHALRFDAELSRSSDAPPPAWHVNAELSRSSDAPLPAWHVDAELSRSSG